MKNFLSYRSLMSYRAKRVYLLPVLLLLAACGPKNAEKVFRASEDTEVRLGRIKEADGPVSFKLLLKNDFQDTLKPLFIYTPCGCTAASNGNRPVPPGEDEVIDVTYNPAYREGKHMEEIQIRYKDSPTPMRSVIFMTEVIGCKHPIEETCRYAMGLDFYSSHKVLAFGNFDPGQTKDMFFHYGNGGKKKMNVSFEVPDEWKGVISLRQPGKMKADQRDTVHVKFTMPAGVDTIRFAIQPIVNGKPTDESIKIKAFLRK